MHQSFLCLFCGCEGIGFKGIEVGLSTARDHDLGIAVVVPDGQDILERQELDSLDMARGAMFHVGHFLLFFCSVFPYLDLVRNTDCQEACV